MNNNLGSLRKQVFLLYNIQDLGNCSYEKNIHQDKADWLKSRFWLDWVHITKVPHCKGIIPWLLDIRKSVDRTPVWKGSLEMVCADLPCLCQMRHPRGPGKPVNNTWHLFSQKSMCCHQRWRPPEEEATASKQLTAQVEPQKVCVCVPKRSHEGPPTLPFIWQRIWREMQVEGWRSIAPALVHVLFSSVSAFLKPSSINEQVLTVPITFWFACKLLQTKPLQAIYIHNILNSSFSSSWPWLLSLLLLLHNLNL